MTQPTRTHSRRSKSTPELSQVPQIIGGGPPTAVEHGFHAKRQGRRVQIQVRREEARGLLKRPRRWDVHAVIPQLGEDEPHRCAQARLQTAAAQTGPTERGPTDRPGDQDCRRRKYPQQPGEATGSGRSLTGIAGAASRPGVAGVRAGAGLPAES